ncbi:MAG: CoA transferase [Chloroflexi bacterium]|nr:CoA transferase [Chloroflexota bacterium]
MGKEPAGGAGPLRGVRVLEAGGGISVSFCGRLFADLGADVIKVEPPEGDPCRRFGPFPQGRDESALSGTFLALNLSKRLVRLDLADRSARSNFFTLVHRADLLVQNLTPREMAAAGTSPEAVAEANPGLVNVCITPFGLNGPFRDFEGSDLIAFHTGGVARFLIGQVEEPESTPPVRAYGSQAEFVAGVTAACAGMIALYGVASDGKPKAGRSLSQSKGRPAPGSVIDVSMQEAMASMFPAQLAHYALEGKLAPRRRELDGGGTTVCVLPASDGFVAISPREEHQWQAWIGVMGNPVWVGEPRFKDKPSRAANWDDLFELMSAWSRKHRKADIVAAAQATHVPSFPWATPSDHLRSPQLTHRGFFRAVEHPDAGMLAVPGSPFGFPQDELPEARPPVTLSEAAARTAWNMGPEAGQDSELPKPRARPGRAPAGRRPRAHLPLEGVRVFDLSWVIAGPACTRYLAAMGAEVIKVEAPGRPDPSRPGHLHEVLGQNKLGVALDLKSPLDFDIAREIIRHSDVVVENFATGVMERLGLGNEQLRALRPDLVVASASGMGRTGPEAGMVAYGTLLQGYTGFSGLNGLPDRPPSIGMAWTDFVCGLAMAFATVAALYDRHRTGKGARIDLSMVETQLMTMPGPILDYVMQGRIAAPTGNRDPLFAPHNVYRCKGDDRWLAVTVLNESQWRALCGLISVPSDWRKWGDAERKANEDRIDEAITEWASGQIDMEAMMRLQALGIPAGASLTAEDLYRDPHLAARDFFVTPIDGRDNSPKLPGLPWRCHPAVPVPRRAPGIGEHTKQIGQRFATAV